MELLILFAFIGGIVTILSPCILPILPVVLSGSVTGGKRRPFGVVTGFILSFTFFTLFLSAIVRATGLSADFMRNLAVVALILFGIALIVPKVQEWIEQLFSKMAGKVPQKKGASGFWGGTVVGLSLGLIWTPCVGPILASVITLALTESVSGAAVIITLAYAIGTALPMITIMYGGRALFKKVPWLLRNTSKIQQVFGVLMIVTAVGIFFNIDRSFQSYILEKFPNYGTGLISIEDNEAVQEQLDSLEKDKDNDNKATGEDYMLKDNFGDAPELISGGEWINIKAPLTLASLQGKVVLVDFWTYSCVNCIRTLPYITQWHSKYNDSGLVIIGVHTPEFEFEKDPNNVRKAIEDFGIKYPVMQDNDFATWKAYSNRYWPAKYLIDHNGKIRYTHFGEGKYDETEAAIQQLLKEAGEKDVTGTNIDNPSYKIFSQTPELYLGYARISNLVSPELINRNDVKRYSSPGSMQLNSFAYDGLWIVTEEYANPQASSSLVLRFSAKDVYLVIRSKEGTSTVKVKLDGQVVTDTSAGDDVIDGVVSVDDNRLYHLVHLEEPGEHILTLEFDSNKLELYAFTFG